MKRNTACLFLFGSLLSISGLAQTKKDSIQAGRNYMIDEVVVTGTRNETDVRHLPMTISVVGRQQIEKRYEPSLLPLLTEQVPGLFTTSRGIMGYGVSTGAAGGMSLRGIGGSPTAGLLVLIDGHPQYMGLMGHPIADAYQSMMAEKVEVLRGPASVLYGSNAMGGVINIVTRRQQEEGVKTNMQVGYGSYNTLQTEFSNRVKKGRFSSVVTGSYNRTDGHRPDMGFEQYGGYAKLGYDISSFWKIWGDVNVTHFNASNPGTIQVPLIDNDSRITRGMTSFALENHYEKTSGGLSFFYNWGRQPGLTDGCKRTAASIRGSLPSSAFFLHQSRKHSPFNWTLSTSPIQIIPFDSSTPSMVYSRVTGCMSPSARPFSIFAPARKDTMASPVQSIVTAASKQSVPSLLAHLMPFTTFPSRITSDTQHCKKTSTFFSLATNSANVSFASSKS